MKDGKLRLANLEDVDQIIPLMVAFVNEEMNQPETPDEDVIRETATSLISKDIEDSLVVVYETEEGLQGIISALVIPSIFSKLKQSLELCFYIKPDYRSFKLYKEMISLYEQWAEEVAGVELVTLALLDPRVEALYKRRGYTFSESSFKRKVG